MPDEARPIDNKIDRKRSPAQAKAPEHHAEARTQPAGTATVPGRRRRRVRLVLMSAGPLVVLLVALGVYLNGGRYMTTDNAYIGAEKVLVTAEVSGKITEVDVKEGQHVGVGDLLFKIDPEPYRIAVDMAQARLEAARLNLANLKQNYQKLLRDIDVARDAVDYQQIEFDRASTLTERKVAPVSQLDRARYDLASAKSKLSSVQQDAQATLAALGGDPNLPLERFPAYMEASAQLESAQRDLRNATVRATIAGVAAQTDLLAPGRYVSTGATMMALVSGSQLWIDANLKETQLDHVAPGQPVEISVDAYPGYTFKGVVHSLSPGTGAEFAVLPPQNASGNWVKVVQRVAVRVLIQLRPGDPPLRAGMSSYVSIDTGHRRSLSDLF